MIVPSRVTTRRVARISERTGFIAAAFSIRRGYNSPVPPAMQLPSARELARNIRRRHVSTRDVMQESLARIHQFNPVLNAIVAKLDDDQCLALADDADR